MLTGYLHPGYAASLSEFGEPQLLPNCGGWVLQRRVPGYEISDAIGCYPLFCCSNWSGIQADLDDLEALDELVSISLVTDPFGDYAITQLQESFRDRAFLFKKHFVVDLRLPSQTFVSSHHQRYARRGFRLLEVVQCDRPTDFLQDWIGLYAHLIRERRIKGIRAFSNASFQAQLALPGIVAFRAVHQLKTVGMVVWYIQGDVAYFHLGASLPLGYELKASFSLMSVSIQHFSALGFRWLSLGAGAGAQSDASDGLSRFKKGWASGTRATYFCGRIFDEDLYRKISGKSLTDYFPAYREGEFS